MITYKYNESLTEDKSTKECIKKDLLDLKRIQKLKYDFRTPAGGLDLTDLSFAEYFVHKYGEMIKYNIQADKWYIWNGKIWIEDIAKLHNYVKKCIKDLFAFAIQLTDSSERNEFLKFCKKCESRINIDNMLILAKKEEIICKNESDFDSYPEYFNCNNILIDLSGNEFKIINRDPELLIRQNAGIEYNEYAECPVLLEILDTIFNGNQNLIDFIQHAVGYSLTGFTTEDCLFFMYGVGGNGKSTFTEILKLLFGDYYHKANIELILQQKNSSVRNDIADLKGKRLVITSEIDQGKRLAESLVKDLTGGDDITARHLYQEHFTFKPTFKIWIYGNHKPIIRGTDDGIKRRIKLIPFNNKIPEDKVRTRDEIMIVIKSELSGILNWALKGYNKFKENGKLIFPDEIKEATKEYFNEMDHIQNFINDCIIKDPDSRIKVKDLYETYKKYSEDNGEIAISGRAFSKGLKEKGFTNEKGTGNYYFWKEISLNEDN